MQSPPEIAEPTLCLLIKDDYHVITKGQSEEITEKLNTSSRKKKPEIT